MPLWRRGTIFCTCSPHSGHPQQTNRQWMFPPVQPGLFEERHLRDPSMFSPLIVSFWASPLIGRLIDVLCIHWCSRCLSCPKGVFFLLFYQLNIDYYHLVVEILWNDWGGNNPDVYLKSYKTEKLLKVQSIWGWSDNKWIFFLMPFLFKYGKYAGQ